MRGFVVVLTYWVFCFDFRFCFVFVFVLRERKSTDVGWIGRQKRPGGRGKVIIKVYYIV